MLNNVCKMIVKHYVLKEKIKLEDIDMYEYCFEVLLSTIINLIILLAIGFGTGNYIGTIIFGIAFMLLGGAYGGIPCKDSRRMFFSADCYVHKFNCNN